jgi:cardiolipin synthase
MRSKKDESLNCTLLINGSEAFPTIIDRIKNAKHEIVISMFIWRDDVIGNEIASELINAADRDVKIHIIKDKVGSIFEKEEEHKTSFFHREFDFKTYLEQKILAFLYFRYLKERASPQENRKLVDILNHPNITVDRDKLRYDHSKYYLIDDKYLITGGINIEDKELFNDLKQRSYADYMIEIEGEDDIRNFKEIVINKKYGDSVSPKNFYVNDNALRVFEIKPKIIELFDHAQQTIDIEMAYWGDKDITNKIIERANKGIAVSIITSREANILNNYNMKVMRQILKKTDNKAKVYLSEKMVHSKFLCIDQKVLFVGSANFNQPGMTKVAELNVLVENDNHAIAKWLSAREEHLKVCQLIHDYRELKYNRLVSFLEGFFC